MRIGLVELLLILLIASLTIGPSAALWVDRWMRRAQKTSAAAARRRAAQEAQRAAEREEVLQRFQKLSIVFVLCAAVALIWGLVLRPIEAAPTPYTAPDVRQETGAQTAAEGGVLELAPYTEISALRENNGWLYAAAKSGKNGCLLRMQPDGTGRTEVLTTAGEITDFAFAPDGTIWMTTLESEGGRLYRVNSDQWGVTVELTVSQIDGRALSCPTAVAAASDGSVYFTDLAAARARHGVESALRTELTAHTGTGSVYVYDPAARTVETVLTGIAGASRLPRCPVAGRGRHALHQLPLGPVRLAGRPRRAHSAAGHGPAAEPDDAGGAVLPLGQRHPRRGGRTRQRQLAADDPRRQLRQHHGALPGGQPGLSGHFRGNKTALGQGVNPLRPALRAGPVFYKTRRPTMPRGGGPCAQG